RRSMSRREEQYEQCGELVRPPRVPPRCGRRRGSRTRGPPFRSGAGGAAARDARIRLDRGEGICVAPQYVAEELLRAEGFTEVTYVNVTIAEKSRAVASGDLDMCLHYVGPATIQVDRGDPITILAGVHVGCFELFGGERVRAIRDLKGKTVAVTGLGLTQHV